MIALFASAWAAPLTLDEVTATVDERIPQLAAADAKRAEVEAKLLSTRGAFDPVLSAKTTAYSGEYDRSIADVSASIQTALGPELTVGYLRGVGKFPSYDGDRETSEAGEWRVGVVVPLLDGLLVGPERAALLTAGLAAEIARADQTAKRIDVRRKAAESWVKWTATGAKLAVEQQLLSVAEARAVALDRQVELGSRARIDQVDNLRVVLERRDKVTQSTADLAGAALELSLWFRDPGGAPIAPPPDRLPALDMLPAPAPAGDLTATPLVAALARAVDAARVEQKRARNALLPDLSVYGESNTDPRAPDEVEVGARLLVSGLMRKERGQQDAAAALVSRLTSERGAALDRLTADVAEARIAVDAAAQRLQWARAAQDAADEVLALEQRRVELGGADLFQLLARETSAAGARRAVVDAWAEHALAVVRYGALTATE